MISRVGMRLRKVAFVSARTGAYMGCQMQSFNFSCFKPDNHEVWARRNHLLSFPPTCEWGILEALSLNPYYTFVDPYARATGHSEVSSGGVRLPCRFMSYLNRHLKRTLSIGDITLLLDQAFRHLMFRT